MSGRNTSDGSLTAANLIDAIITHQISQTAVDPPPMPSVRDPHRAPYVSVEGNTICILLRHRDLT